MTIIYLPLTMTVGHIIHCVHDFSRNRLGGIFIAQHLHYSAHLMSQFLGKCLDRRQYLVKTQTCLAHVRICPVLSNKDKCPHFPQDKMEKKCVSVSFHCSH